MEPPDTIIIKQNGKIKKWGCEGVSCLKQTTTSIFSTPPHTLTGILPHILPTPPHATTTPPRRRRPHEVRALMRGSQLQGEAIEEFADAHDEDDHTHPLTHNSRIRHQRGSVPTTPTTTHTHTWTGGRGIVLGLSVRSTSDESERSERHSVGDALLRGKARGISVNEFTTEIRCCSKRIVGSIYTYTLVYYI